jgi:ribosomal protein S27AE
MSARTDTTPAAKLAALARRSLPGASLTYRGGADGHVTDCPTCGQAVRVALHSGRLTARCYGGCGAEQLLEALDTTRVAAELRRAAR